MKFKVSRVFFHTPVIFKLVRMTPYHKRATDSPSNTGFTNMDIVSLSFFILVHSSDIDLIHLTLNNNKQFPNTYRKRTLPHVDSSVLLCIIKFIIQGRRS